MGKIFYIMGKSASGKDKIYSRLLANEQINLKKLILYTTRPIRQEKRKENSIILRTKLNWKNSGRQAV